MALLTMPSDYVVGTISFINGSVDFSGTGTAWQLVGLKEGDLLIDVDGATQFWAIIDEITSNVAGKLTRPWAGPDLTDALYRMRFTSDGVRSTAQAAMLRQELGNGRVQAISTATGTSGVLEYLPGGGAQLVPKTDLISGAAYDVQVADIAARAAYDGQAAGYAVLVADTGDGRSAIYSKASNASGDWTAPAYVTGPAITLDVTEVDEVPYGEPPDVTLTPRAGGYDMAFQIPRGMIIEPGTTTTLAPDQPAAVTFVPVTGGFRIDIAIPRGPTGDITGVTPFWNMRLGADEDAAAALTGLGLTTFMQQRVTEDETPEDTRAALNIVLADQPTAEAGLDAEQFMTPLTTALAILALSPPTDTSDLETTVSQIALREADRDNVVIFLGPTGNRVADSFDTLTYVDVAGATNLDTSAPGILKPTSSAAVLIPQATGTAIFSGFNVRTSTLFDGITNQVETSAAQMGSPGTSALVGKDYSAAPKSVSSARVYGTSDNGYTSGSGNSTSFKIRGKNGSAPSGPTDGTLLGQVLSVPDTNTTNMQTIPSADTDTLFDYLWIEFLNSASASMLAAEVEFYTPPVVNNLTVRSASFSAAAAPAKMKALLRVKEVSLAVAGTDYTLECSRDAGATWTVMPLSEMFATGGLLYVETAQVDVSGQPSGTSPRWRLKTLTNKNVELHDVYFYWS